MDNKIKILIVEDEALIAENLKCSLEDLGYEVTDTCYTYAEALEAIGQTTADLFLLDINLGRQPHENGLALAELIISKCRKPFIFLTAYSDLDTIRRATRLQPSGYLIKPANSAALFATIQTAIEHFTNQRAFIPAIESPPLPDYFFVKVGTKAHKLLWEDIYCIESGKNYVKLRSIITRTDYPIRGSLTYVMDNLVPKKLEGSFIRVNRAVCLNRKYITAYDNDYVYCGTEKYENARTAMKQLQELILK